MKPRQFNFRVEICTLVLVICAAGLPHFLADDAHLISKTTVASGWHPWYEIKVDPEDSQNLLLCGTKWDAQTNAPFGFVYASSDQGTSWVNVLEDRNSAWVTEQSCAFGTRHRAYFISEASKVVDGTAHHELGTTRLYVSSDAGHSWKQSLETGWADWSTSVVGLASGRLFTFFNAYTVADPAKKLGSSVGLLTFSPDGSTVSGPFFASSIGKQNYQGAYPSDALALRAGTIVALWYGTRLGPSGIQADLNVVRASEAQPPVLESVVVSRSKDNNGCMTLNQASLAYEPRRDRLFVLYIDGCKEKQILSVFSDDEGKTWSKSTVIAEAKGPFAGFSNPSLVAVDDRLALLWQAEDGSGHWFVSAIEAGEIISAIELSSNTEVQNISNKALLTSIKNSASSSVSPSSDSNFTMLSVRNESSAIWRVNGLLAIGNELLAAWPSDEGDDTELRLATLSRSVDNGRPSKVSSIRDVTKDSVILYGGMQEFNKRTSELTVCLALKNKSSRPLKAPIKLEAKSLTSTISSVVATNASNGVSGTGAIWDISNSLTGDEIPPGATSNPFCLSFRLDPTGFQHRLAAHELLKMTLSVLTFHAGD